MKKPQPTAPSVRTVAIVLIAVAILAAFAASVHRPTVEFTYSSDRPAALSYVAISDALLFLDDVRVASFEAPSVEIQSALTVYGLPATNTPAFTARPLTPTAALDSALVQTGGRFASIREDGTLSGDLSVPTILYRTEEPAASVSFSSHDPSRLRARLMGHQSTGGTPTGFRMTIQYPGPYHGSITIGYANEYDVPDEITTNLRTLKPDPGTAGSLVATTETFLLYIYDETRRDCRFQMNSPSGGLPLDYCQILVAYNGHPATVTAPITGQSIRAASSAYGESTTSTGGLVADLRTSVSEVSTLLQPAHLAVGRQHFELQELDRLHITNIAPLRLALPLGPAYSRDAGAWIDYTSSGLRLISDPPATTQLYFGGTSSGIRLNGEQLSTSLWDHIPESVRVTLLAVLAALLTSLVTDALTKHRPS